MRAAGLTNPAVCDTLEGSEVPRSGAPISDNGGIHMFELITALLAALPMGDNTPILLYILVAVIAIALVVACVILGKKTKK